MAQSLQLSELQLAVMGVLWSREEASVAEVAQDLATSRALAPTTVATLLSRLRRRGLLDHRTEGRQFIYRPLVSREQVQAAMVGGLTESLFGGDSASLVCHLLRAGDMSTGDLDRVRALIAEAEMSERGGVDVERR